MDSFQWNDTYIIGQKEIDDQHFYLVGLINQFSELIMGGHASLEEVDNVYQELESYAVYHFQEEEELMRKAGIYPESLATHIASHHAFLKKVVLMHNQVKTDRKVGSKHLLDFLVNWLIFHILVTDKNMGRQIDKIAEGMPAKEAFQSEMTKVDSTTEALVVALNNLFYQVEQRNIELEELNQTLETKVSERTRELQVLNNDLLHLSVTDQLTGLPNRRFAISRLNKLWADTENRHQPLSCLMIDVDNFKIINDTYGHDAGDKVLVELTLKLQQTLRNDDIVCRLGGDEFLVICENTDSVGANYVAQLLSESIQKLVVSVGEEQGEWVGSISIGVATRQSAMKHIDDLIKAADQGVYLAKEAGKGCIKSI